MIHLSLAGFINRIMTSRGLKAPRMCAKDPDIVKHLIFMHELFPKAKFIYMVRDGRAASTELSFISIISIHININILSFLVI